MPENSSSPSVWWKNAVVYQIYPRSFADSNADGVGDLQGIIEHLDYLSQLGVDVLWLSPVYPSPHDDNGYDISDYQGIDALFGTLADFDRLLAAVHERGMKLVMDLVVNHTSDEHPWFTASRDQGTDGERRDWYIWRPARDGMEPGTPGAEPNNWESWFSGPAWTYDVASGEYYLRTFSRKQPDLNWDNPEVRQAVYTMMRWWLERGVDGFRMDVINLISKDPALPDGQTPEGSRYGDGSPFYVCGPRVHDYLAEMHREVFADHPRRLLTVGEMPGVTIEQARAFTDPERRELDMVFQFEHVGLDQGPGGKFDVRPLKLTDLKASLARWQTGLARTGWNSLYFSNHDQPRSVSRFGDDSPFYRYRSAKLLATVLHLHRGTPYIYQGEELAMANAPFTAIDDYRDIETLNHYREQTALGAEPQQVLAGLGHRSRDHARTPMQWDATEHAGFTTGSPWIGANPDHIEVNAKAQLADADSVFHYYRRLIDLRHTEPAVTDGDFTLLHPEHEQLYAFTRHDTATGTELLVLANFSTHDLTVDLPDGWTGTDVVIANVPATRPLTARHTLQPWEARVHRRRTR
ncbi:glycoside hydrolase family 13 protein [Streptomyces sp. BH105]|uniref:glycoside hydrolase family 13 protein n=1 Tax=Streptomyces sp. BH105 TaxID=3410408 RepID=UPI003CE70A3B